jgi:DNA-binding CsgD family transcriptional regulator
MSAAAELDRVAEVCARLNLSVDESELADELLEPIAGLVGAETASLRCFGLAHGVPAPLSIVSIGIPASVKDAYLGRYFHLDPIRALLARRLDRPLFADPLHSGEWSSETTVATTPEVYRGDFRRYRREFLLPNHFYHHLGFCVQDSAGKVLALDFHRAQRSRDFAALEHARARVVAAYLYAKAAGERAVPAAGLALSPREAQVAEAVANGCSNKQVAETLSISVRTVENHLRSIFAKCGVTTRTRLAAKLRGGHGAARD